MVRWADVKPRLADSVRVPVHRRMHTRRQTPNCNLKWKKSRHGDRRGQKQQLSVRPSNARSHRGWHKGDRPLVEMSVGPAGFSGRFTRVSVPLRVVPSLRNPTLAPQLEETPEMPPSSRGEGLLFLPGLESNHESSLKSEEEAGLP